MKQYTKDIKFVVAFLVLELLIAMLLSTKIAYSFMLLVLASMLLLNTEIIEKFFGGLNYDE